MDREYLGLFIFILVIILAAYLVIKKDNWVMLQLHFMK